MYSIRKRKTLFNKHNNRKIAKMFLLNFTIAKVSELLEVFWNQVHHWNNKCMLHLFLGTSNMKTSSYFPAPIFDRLKQQKIFHLEGTLVRCHYRRVGSVIGPAVDTCHPLQGERSCCLGTFLQIQLNFWIPHYWCPATREIFYH